MKDKIKVVFFGKEYSVVTDAEKDYVMEIVNYLEQKITQAAGGGPTVTVSPPVFLASLEIVDDFCALQREFDEFKRTAERKTEELVGLLESPGNSESEEPLLVEESSEDPFRSRGSNF